MAGRPAEEALNLFTSHSHLLGARPAIVVEGGYVDPSDTSSDRAEHARDSWWLTEQIMAVPQVRRGSIVWTELINDFSGREREYCGFAVCDNEHLGTGHRAASAARRTANVAETDNIAVEHYYMRSTRNRASSRIKHLLKSGNDDLLVKQRVDGDITDVYAQTPDGEVLLGHRPTLAKRGLTMRCAALMAQHYFDLFRETQRQHPALTDFVVFDFNRYVERDRVRQGAAATAVLYEWPAAIGVVIVNCVYFPAEARVTSLQVTSWPTMW